MSSPLPSPAPRRPRAPVERRRARRSPPPPTRRLGPTLFRSILRELAFPTLFALGGVTLLVLAIDLVAYSDLVINRGFGAREVGWVALYRLLPMIGRAVPIAVLVGTLVALGRLGADREIVALESAGLSARALVRPIAVFALLLTAVNAAISLAGAPWANRSLDAALTAFGDADEERGTPLRPGAVQRIGEWRVVAREVSPRGDVLRAVVLWAPPLGGTVFAERATLGRDAEGRRRLVIENGVVVADLTGEPTQVRFDRMQQTLGAPRGGRDGFDIWTSAARLDELAAAVRGDDPARRHQALEEAHQRLALPMATLVFALLAVPLSVARQRPSRSSGAVMGLGAIAVYYGLVQLGSGLARTSAFPVGLAVWLPDLVLGGLAIALLVLVPGRRGAGGRRFGRSRPAAAERAAAPRLRLHRRVLDRHLLRTFGELALLCFAGLLAAYLVIDVLDNLKWFTKYRSTPDEVLRFYAARLPLLASRVVPMALLLGAALTLGLLGANGELIGMRACGIPSTRIIGPVLIACLLVAAAYVPLVNELVPRANARASRIKQIDIKGKSTVRTSVWSLSGDRLLEADSLDPMAGTASGVVLYQLGPDGLPRARIDAPVARHVGDGNWRLVDAARFEMDGETIRRVPADPLVRLGEETVVEVEGEHLSVGELRREIRTLEERGFDATAFRVDLALKLAAPLACVLLPALALLFAAGGPPFPKPQHTLVASAIAAGGWLLLTAVGASLGYGGALPPWVAGFGPVTVLAAAGFVLATRLRGFGWSA